jgi:hypothetical protein
MMQRGERESARLFCFVGVSHDREAGKSVQWTDLSGERREQSERPDRPASQARFYSPAFTTYSAFFTC